MSENNLIALTMPKWGMAMETGKVVEWLVNEGNEINKGDEILEVETEKIVNAMEAQQSGTLARLVAQPGDELPVGALLGVITDGTADVEAIDSFVNEFQSNFVPEEHNDDDSSEPERISIKGRDITYLKVQANETEEKTPIILVHGFGSDRNSWLFNIAALVQQRSLYLLDLPGYGSSSKDVGDGSIGFFADFLCHFMDEMKIEKAHLLGHSMGASIIVNVAASQPDRIASLALLSGGGLGEAIDADFINHFVSAERRKDLKPVLQKLFADDSLVSREMINDVLKFKRIEGVKQALEKIVQASFSQIDGRFDYSQLHQGFSMPVISIWGREDRIAGLSDENKSVPISVNWIDNCGHVPHMEAAAKVNDLLADFYQGLS